MDESDVWLHQVDPRVVRLARPLVRALGRVHPVRFEGAEHLPDGPALLVGNHGLLGYETAMFFERLLEATGRVPIGLADRWFFRVPLLRQVLVRIGGTYGSPKNAVRALRSGSHVVCYPGGVREVFKRSDEDRYRLRWEHSLGFVRVALEAGVPVVPFAAAGVDDTFHILGQIPGSGARLMGHDKYDLPLLWGAGPLPNPVPFWFRIGRPVDLGAPPEASSDEQTVARLHAVLWQTTQTLLDATVRDYREALAAGLAEPPSVRS